MMVWVVENLNCISWVDGHILGVFTKREDAIIRVTDEIRDKNIPIASKFEWPNGDMDWYIEDTDEDKITITQIVLDSFA